MTATDLPTADQCEQIFHAALKQGDIRGVEAALRILIVHDPYRAERLMDLARMALIIVEGVDR
jgi:hypothetical protein